MNVLATLLWLEYKRTAWVVYGALIGLALFALVLLSLPGVVTGPDLLNLPVTGTEDDCQSPDCEPSGHSSLQMSRESSDENSTFSWSFSRTWGDESAIDPGIGPAAEDEAEGEAAASVIEVPIPEELQLAFRPRQAVTAATAMGLTGLMLFGFWIAHYREADRGEMVMLCQSPVSGDAQLALRFFCMGGAAAVFLIAVLATYWIVQTSQSYAPLAPIAEVLGSRIYIHWGSLALVTLTTQILPSAAFILLFIQLQNAYSLLGGQRLVGWVLTLAALSLSAGSFFWVTSLDPEASSALLRIVSVERNPTLDSMVGNFQPDRYRIDVPVEFIALGAGVSALMLILSGRIWREVEWS